MARLFTAAELEEMRRADEEIDREFSWTKEEIAEARERERDIVLSQKSEAERKIAAYHKAYYEANREEIAAKKKAYYRRRKNGRSKDIGLSAGA